MKRIVAFSFICGTAAGFNGAYQGRELRDSIAVEAKKATSAEVSIAMRAGDLNLTGGARQLMDGQFLYQESLKPHADYKENGQMGLLNIHTVGDQDVHLESVKSAGKYNQWDLRFGEQIPLNLKAEMGTGNGTLRLGGIPLNSLQLHVGTGNVVTDFTGRWKKDARASIYVGVGNAKVQLPKAVGVRLHVTSGLGSVTVTGLQRKDDYYVNDRYGKSPVTLYVDVFTSLGNATADCE